MRWTDLVCFIKTGIGVEICDSVRCISSVFQRTDLAVFVAIWWMENVQRHQPSEFSSTQLPFPTFFLDVKFGSRVCSESYFFHFYANITIWNSANLAATCNRTELLPAPLHSKTIPTCGNDLFHFPEKIQTHVKKTGSTATTAKSREEFWPRLTACQQSTRLTKSTLQVETTFFDTSMSSFIHIL